MDDTRNEVPVVYEFCGSPGAGKTYLAKQLVTRKLCNAHMVSLDGENRYRRFLKKILAIVQHPGILTGHLLTNIQIVRLHDPRAKDFFRLVYNMSFVSSMLVKHRLGRAIVLDQGLIQAEWSNYYHGRTSPNRLLLARRFERLIEQLGVQSLAVIDVQVPGHVARERIGSRVSGGSPLDGGGDESWVRAENALVHMAEFVRSLEACCPTVHRVVMINSGNGISDGVLDRIVGSRVGDSGNRKQ